MKKFVKKIFVAESLNEWEGPESEGMASSFPPQGDYQYSDAARISRELDSLAVDDTVVLVVTKEDDGFFKWKKGKGWT